MTTDHALEAEIYRAANERLENHLRECHSEQDRLRVDNNRMAAALFHIGQLTSRSMPQVAKIATAALEGE